MSAAPCPVCGDPVPPDDSPVGPQDIVVCRDCLPDTPCGRCGRLCPYMVLDTDGAHADLLCPDCLPDGPAIDEYDDHKDREAGL